MQCRHELGDTERLPLEPMVSMTLRGESPCVCVCVCLIVRGSEVRMRFLLETFARKQTRSEAG